MKKGKKKGRRERKEEKMRITIARKAEERSQEMKKGIGDSKEDK